MNTTIDVAHHHHHDVWYTKSRAVTTSHVAWSWSLMRHITCDSTWQRCYSCKSLTRACNTCSHPSLYKIWMCAVEAISLYQWCLPSLTLERSLIWCRFTWHRQHYHRQPPMHQQQQQISSRVSSVPQVPFDGVLMISICWMIHLTTIASLKVHHSQQRIINGSLI